MAGRWMSVPVGGIPFLTPIGVDRGAGVFVELCVHAIEGGRIHLLLSSQVLVCVPTILVRGRRFLDR